MEMTRRHRDTSARVKWPEAGPDPQQSDQHSLFSMHPLVWGSQGTPPIQDLMGGET